MGAWSRETNRYYSLPRVSLRSIALYSLAVSKEGGEKKSQYETSSWNFAVDRQLCALSRLYESETTRHKQIMATAHDSVRGIIERALASPPDGADSDASGVRLLRLFADASSHFIGEQGFSAMLFRCARSVVAEFPWIATDTRERRIRQRASIDNLIEAEGPVNARRARLGLLNCCADFLTLMVGDRATLLIFENAFDRIPDGPAPIDEATPEI